MLRGYDPVEVDRAIGDLIKARDQARSEAADNALVLSRVESELAEVKEQVAGYRAQLAKAETATPETPVASEIGARIGRMLALAEDEASALRTEASAEAERVLSAAKAEAEQLTGNAERHARDVVSKSDTEAARILEAARRQSDEIVDYADREAVARREEAESIYEAHRSRAAAAADEFERNVTDRQQQADAEFASRSEVQEQAITALLERQEALQAEAEHAAGKARAEADTILRAAQAEAREHVEAAHVAAAEVHSQAMRDLQSTLARREAVTAQLATVRQLLADLDAGLTNPSPAAGDPLVPQPAEEDPAEASSSRTPASPASPASPDSPASPASPGEAESAESETPGDFHDAETENEGMARIEKR